MTRTEIATRAYLKAYGVNREQQEAWGLKTSPTDAFNEVVAALYPDAQLGADDGAVDGLIDALWDLECDGLEAEKIAEEILPMIDDLMWRHLLAQATDLGVDVERERCDWFMVAEMLHEIRQTDDIPAAVRAVNDGARPTDYRSY